MKRFYKKATVQAQADGWQVALDGRGIKTPKGAPQVVPSEEYAKALAAEWDAQGEEIDPTSLPLRDMADYALDILAPAPDELIEKLIAFGDTDTLLYRADPDEALYARQQEIWEPIVTAFEARAGVSLVRVSGIIHRPQAEETFAKLRALLANYSPFALAAIEVLTSLSASLTIAIGAAEAENEEQALALWQAACLEEEWQAEEWGRDEEAEERRAKRAGDFLRAWRAVRLAV